MLLQEIENKYNFQYPQLYHALYADNMLYMGEKGNRWFTDEYPKLKDRPPFLLYAVDFELLHLDEIIEELEAFRDPTDYRRTDPKHQFVPFGKNGAGDLYCLYFNEQTQDVVPVVLVWHDDNKAVYEAKNLQDFIFRELLMAVVDPREPGSDFLEKMNKLLATHEKYVTPEQAETITGIYKRELFDYTYTNGGKQINAKGLLTDSEFDTLTNLEAPFSTLGKSFSYDLPEPMIEETEENKRRVGALTLTVSPLPDLKLSELIKKLNWRKVNSENTVAYVVQRKGCIIFGIPAMNTIEDTFRNKLQELKDKFPQQVQLTFTEDETGKIYKL